MTLQEIGEVVRLRRRELRITQIDLAQRAQVGRSTVNALENGLLPELGTGRLLNILEALGLTLAIDRLPTRRPTLDDRYAEQARRAEQESKVAPSRYRR